MKEKKTTKKLVILDISYLPLLIVACATTFVVYMTFQQTQSILKERLRERITSIVATAAVEFNGSDIQKIINEEDKLSEELKKINDEMSEKFNAEELQKQVENNKLLNNHPIVTVTKKMKEMRSVNKNLTYIYLLQPTETEHLAKFITDADTVFPVDWDENGKIDELEYPPLPGEDYDVTDIPAVEIAFKTEAVAMDDLYTDKWGTFLSGFAPIRNEKGEIIAVIGADVQVDDFFTVIRATLIPFVVLAAVLLAMLAIQTILLVRIWASRVEIVKELDKQKDELLSIVSHQLATPVSSIKWYLEMLLDGDIGAISEDQKKHVITMQGITTNLVDLIGMILDVSRIQLGRMQLNPEKFQFNALIDEILSVITPKVLIKKQKLIVKIADQIPELTLDKRVTRMVIENLLSNAVKYTPENGEVEFIAKLVDNRLVFSIRDTGCGIPESEQKKIFQKLYRASNVQSVEGNGFGLYIVKGAVEGQKGTIVFNSIVNKGTTFTVNLPIKIEKQ